jgi:tetratricopeptide (TPR) repeat protein
LFYLNKYDEAIIEATTAIRLQDRFSEAYQIRGNALLAKSQLDPAIADLSLAIRLNQRDLKALIGRGSAYFQLSQFAKALPDFDAALKVDPASFEARLRRADTYKQLGQPEKARADFKQLASSKPDRPDAYFKRAIALEGDGQFDAAIADAAKAMELEPKLAWGSLLIMASAKLKKGELDGALGDASRAIDLDGTSTAALQIRAGVKHRLKRFDEALEDCRKAMELAPADPTHRLNYAYALSRVGDYAGAKRELEEAERAGTRSAWFYNNLAWLLSTADDDKIRDGAKAEEAIKEAIELMPKEGRIWDTQAAVCAERGRFEEAVKWQKRYLTLKTLTSEQRKDGQRRLEFYQKRQPYRQGPGE